MVKGYMHLHVFVMQIPVNVGVAEDAILYPLQFRVHF